METYTEEEYQRHSGTHLEEEGEEGSGSESDSDNEQGGSSIEFQNGTFSEESFGSEESSSLDSDSFHSANDDEVVFSEDVSSLSPLGPEGLFNRHGNLVGEGGMDNSQEDVFMNDFSDTSEESGEGGNILGKLEIEVMNLSISNFRRCVWCFL